MGGNVFKNVQTNRIRKEEIPATVQYLVTKLNALDFTFDYAINSLVGSTGIKETSGDIDIAMNDSKCQFIGQEELPVFSKKKMIIAAKRAFGEAFVRVNSDDIHIAIPIEGNEINGFVQVDLIFGDYRWLKFFNIVNGESNFKSLFRGTLMFAIANVFPIWEKRFNSGKVSAKITYLLTTHRGMTVTCKYRTSETESFKSVSYEEFETFVEGSAHTPRDFSSCNPEDFIRIFFGEDVSPIDIDSFEKMYKIMKNNHPNILDELEKVFLNILPRDHKDEAARYFELF